MTGMGTLYAKRIDDVSTLILIERSECRTSIKLVKTTDLLFAAAQHFRILEFDDFYAKLGTIGAFASVTSTGMDHVATDLGLSFVQKEA